MIQRVQTLYFIVAAILTGLLFFFPVAVFDIPAIGTYEFFTTKVVQTGEAPALMAWNYMSLILHAFTFILIMACLLLYKKRFIQLRLCIVNIVLQLGLFVMILLLVFSTQKELEAAKQFQLACCFPLVSVILLWMACRGIIKDIILLKSYDRIR